ncbi:anthranilate phosphoribosyltransferase [Sulfolobus tengchongensis]|uniref:Anthranilate phosphoribosyltransferase n=1 Tax=Sulfolobus tengchongensis TaxID=207809 RepID=A0AAX4L0T1_9CREN
MNINEILKKLINKSNLEIEEAEELAKAIIRGDVPEILTSAILVALRMKGESISEIVGFARAMRELAIKIDVHNAIDTAGTGGDGLSTVNVSTASAILLSLVNPVAKHGNRAVSGKSGSADVLEALGYNIVVPPEKAKELIHKTNFVFLFAQYYHPAMKNVANVRRTLGIRTIFNILGPLTNPANAKYQLMGVFSKDYLNLLSKSALELDFKKIVLVHGEPGIDEVSPIGKTFLSIVTNGNIEEITINVTDFGISPIPIDRLIVNSSEDSAIKIIRAFLGKDEDVARFLRINTAVGLFVLDKVSDFREGYEYAGYLIDKSIDKLNEIISLNGDLNRLKAIMARVNGS